MKIEILLSTYNGEKYLGELLDSLVNQDYLDFHITIRDDGSNDSTLEIINEYQNNYNSLISFVRDDKNLGYPDCFWWLLENSRDADMYAFCDQDDIWEPNKLKSVSERCSDTYKEKPILYVHDYKLGDSDLNIYGSHKLAEEKFDPNYPYNTIFFVMTQGFTMVINELLRQRILLDNLTKKNIPHDRWTFWCGFFAGDIVYDDKELAIYRRHEDSVTETGKGALSLIKDWWNEDVKGDRLAGWCKVSRFFAKCYGQEMSQTVRRRWLLLSGYNKGMLCYFMRLFYPARLKPSLPGELVLRICFLLNKK